jgi:dihydroorotate dehydrogenase (fumarate)
MANLKTTYLGIELNNPVIVGSCNLTTDESLLKKLEEAGASAIVYKSLFEEQIQLENYILDDKLNEFNERNAEMTRLFPNIEHAGPEEYLYQLARTVKLVNIPVFASLNAVQKETWIEYAKKIEDMGVAGLELNFYSLPFDEHQTESDIIKQQVEIAASVVNALQIPISVKLSPFYANIIHVVKQFDNIGVKGFVLFNRLFQPDFDLEREIHHFPYNLSSPEDNRLPLRFTGLLYGKIKGNICANTGIFTGEDVVKMILAGADAVQIVSTIYRNKPEIIVKILSTMNEWMDSKNYTNLNDFKGKLSAEKSTDIFAYKRVQYVDILMKSVEIFKKYPLA